VLEAESRIEIRAHEIVLELRSLVEGMQQRLAAHRWGRGGSGHGELRIERGFGPPVSHKSPRRATLPRRLAAPLRPAAYDRWPSSVSGLRAAARPRVLPSAGCRQTGRRTSVLLPNSDSIRSTASTAVLLRTSNAGLSSTTSSEARRRVSAIISMHNCASR